MRVPLLHSSGNLGASSSVDVASLQGNYVAPISGSAIASFSVTGEGRILPGTSACRLSSTVGNKAPSLPGTLAVSLNSGGCGSALPLNSSGVLIFDREHAPAVFRPVTDDRARPVILQAFTE